MCATQPTQTHLCVCVCICVCTFSHLLLKMYIHYTLSHKEYLRSPYSNIARNMFVLYLLTKNTLYLGW